MKHPYIIFVGDRPSGKNKSPEIPFVGTPSYRTLLQWIHALDLDFRACDMINASDLETDGERILSMNSESNSGRVKIIALGLTAAKCLDDCGLHGFYTLPHPSPKNRKLNDKRYVNAVLKQMKKKIHDF